MTPTTTSTFDLVGIVKALAEGTSFISGKGWHTFNEQPGVKATTEARMVGPNAMLQNELANRLRQIDFNLERLPELKAWFSMSCEELNRRLREEGFEIQLHEWKDDGRTFGVVSILDITVEWLEAGDGKEFVRVYPKGDNGCPNYNAQPTKYPAFELYTEKNKIEFFDAEGTNQPLIMVPTKSGDRVWIHQMGDVDLDRFDLYDTAAALLAGRKPNDRKYYKVEDVKIPKIKVRQQPDIRFLVGMWSDGTNPRSNEPDSFGIEEALQEVRFAMNEVGARAKTATAFTARSLSAGGPIEHVVVNDNFLIIIERPGMSVPVFVAYLDKSDSWSDPGDLDKL